MFTLRTRKDELNRRQLAQLEEEARDDEREDLNLLYVAMTRARSILIASGCEGRSASSSWYARLRAAVATESGIEDADPNASLCFGAAFDRDPGAPPARTDNDYVRPDDVRAIPAIVPTGQRRETSSTRGQLYGVAFHRLMECLIADPSADAQTIARSCGLGAVESAQCCEQVRALLASTDLRRFFDDRCFVRAFNELPLVNESGELRRIDRMVEFEDAIWVLDYKTGRYGAVAGTALDIEYREQVDAYCRSLALAYPNKPVHGALVFADGRLIDVC